MQRGGGKGRVKSPRGRSAHAPLPNDVTPGKINMVPENDGLEDDFPFQLGDF